MSDSGEALRAMRERMEAVIFPGEAGTPQEREALERACRAQLAWERARQASRGGLPEGAVRAQLGEASVSLAQGREGFVLCPQARGLLLRAGLLYKGVER